MDLLKEASQEKAENQTRNKVQEAEARVAEADLCRTEAKREANKALVERVKAVAVVKE